MNGLKKSRVIINMVPFSVSRHLLNVFGRSLQYPCFVTVRCEAIRFKVYNMGIFQAFYDR